MATVMEVCHQQERDHLGELHDLLLDALIRIDRYNYDPKISAEISDVFAKHDKLKLAHRAMRDAEDAAYEARMRA